MSDVGFLDEVAGAGYSNLSGDNFATPFIKLLQSNSREVTSELEGAKPGVFFDSANNVVLGNTIQVIPLDFEVLWMEWEENMGGLKGKYLPGSIPAVGDRFSRKNPETGRELTDSWCYYVLLAGQEEKGVCILSLPVSTIKYLKTWNTQIHNSKLPSGKPAPFFGSVWQIGPTKKDTNDKGQVWYNIGDAKGPAIERKDFITKDQYQNYVLPGLESAHQVMLSYQVRSQAQQPLLAGKETKALPSAPKNDEEGDF